MEDDFLRKGVGVGGGVWGQLGVDVEGRFCGKVSVWLEDHASAARNRQPPHVRDLEQKRQPVRQARGRSRRQIGLHRNLIVVENCRGSRIGFRFI